MKTVTRNDPTYAYDTPTYSSAIVDIPILRQGFAEVGNTQPSTTTTIGFLTRDPIGYRGSPWNLYEYVGGHPIVLMDPLGEGWWPWTKCPPPKVITYTPIPIPPTATPVAYDATLLADYARRKFGTILSACIWLETVVLPSCRGHEKCMKSVLLAMNILNCKGPGGV